MKTLEHDNGKMVLITSLMPSFVTILALFIGIQQFKYAIHSNWRYVVIALITSGVLDATDGRLARFLGVSSRFGAELDSLSDLVVFGAAPAFAMYQFALNNFPDRLSWSVVALYIICLAVRLARFNANDIENKHGPLSKYGFSTGLAAPSCAVSAVFPIILFNATGYEVFKDKYFCLIVLLITSFLSVSTIATPTIKKLYIKKENTVLYIMLATIGVVLVYSFMWYSLIAIVVTYYLVTIYLQKKVHIIIKESKQEEQRYNLEHKQQDAE